MTLKASITYFILFIWTICSSFAATEVNGIVKDKANGSALPYATISLLGQNYGIIADETGTFRLDVASVSTKDTIQVSFVGYHTLKLTTTELFKKKECLLEPIIFQIDEVEIKPDDAKKILRMAYDRYLENHIHKGISTLTYIRDQFFEGQECVRLDESVMSTKIYEEKGENLNSKVPLLSRSIVDSSFLVRFNKILNMRSGIMEKIQKNMEEEDLKADKYHKIIGDFFLGDKKSGYDIAYKSRERYELNGRENYYLHFNVSRKNYQIATGHFLIDRENYGIAAIEIHCIEQEDLTQHILPAKVRLLLKVLGYKIEIQNFDLKITNRFSEGKWYNGNGIQILKGGVAGKGDWIFGKTISEFYSFDQSIGKSIDLTILPKEEISNDFSPAFWKDYPFIPIQPKQEEYIRSITERNLTYSPTVYSTKENSKKSKKVKN